MAAFVELVSSCSLAIVRSAHIAMPCLSTMRLTRSPSQVLKVIASYRIIIHLYSCLLFFFRSSCLHLPLIGFSYSNNIKANTVKPSKYASEWWVIAIEWPQPGVNAHCTFLGSPRGTREVMKLWSRQRRQRKECRVRILQTCMIRRGNT